MVLRQQEETEKREKKDHFIQVSSSTVATLQKCVYRKVCEHVVIKLFDILFLTVSAFSHTRQQKHTHVITNTLRRWGAAMSRQAALISLSPTVGRRDQD